MSIDHAQCGHLDCAPEERSLGANLGLYSVTFNNDFLHDLATLERFHEFREEAERKGFRYFLEVFDPNVPNAIAPDVLPRFINDMITRMLAGVAPAGTPRFLKIVYHGPKAMEELVRYDPRLVVGILGGSAGTTRDAFQLLYDAQKYGAKVALFGRKINNAENQLAFVQFLRLIVDGVIGPVDAVKAYHAVLGRLGVAPRRSLDDDLKLTDTAVSYAGNTSAKVTVPPMPAPSPVAAPTNGHACECHAPKVTTAAPAHRRTVSPNGTASQFSPTAAPISRGWTPRRASRTTATGSAWVVDPGRVSASDANRRGVRFRTATTIHRPEFRPGSIVPVRAVRPEQAVGVEQGRVRAVMAAVNCCAASWRRWW